MYVRTTPGVRSLRTNYSLAAQKKNVPGWPPLLQIYLAFFLPVLLALLFSLNTIVWESVRINYIFIFGSCFSVFLIPTHGMQNGTFELSWTPESMRRYGAFGVMSMIYNPFASFRHFC